MSVPNIDAAKNCIHDCLQLIQDGEKERRLRDTFTSHLRLIFPDAPWWVEDHIKRSEAGSACTIAGKAKRGFVDNLVGLTAIEYEADLSSSPCWKEGLHQVKEYCAGLINAGANPDLVNGVLSDTIRWHAFKVSKVVGKIGKLGPDDIEVTEIDKVRLDRADDAAAKRLIKFLIEYLGRLGARQLSAATIAQDLGFASNFCSRHAESVEAVVKDAIKSRPAYAKLIQKLWTDFVMPVSGRKFDDAAYAGELYILTLAKLICANVIEKKALISDDAELGRILSGDFFVAKGLRNLVEYDYFGWLNTTPNVIKLIPIARDLQDDLRAYDFVSAPAEDLFGRMLVQLAQRSQRILLGQEWTPQWLAERLVNRVLGQLPKEVDPQLIDMSCGSGAIVVEAVKAAKQRIAGRTKGAAQAEKLTRAITGFDIDPLAVMLAKVSWILAARDWLEPFDGSHQLSIPIYHADSLFAITPLSTVDLKLPAQTLLIDDQRVALPTFLLSPEHQLLFDALIDRAYSIAMATAAQKVFSLPKGTVEATVNDAMTAAKSTLDASQITKLEILVGELVKAIDTLQRNDRNGLWAFILRNTYRPGLVAGQFNGLVSNPPWLALSKVGDNPYKRVLTDKASDYEILPSGETRLHTELATIFLLHAVDRYLERGAEIGCILPDSVLNGKQHDPFRRGKFLGAARKAVPLQVTEAWRVLGAFTTNEAIVLFGTKRNDATVPKKKFPGVRISETDITATEFHVIDNLDRVIWTEDRTVKSGQAEFDNSPFRQGADVFPRRLWFHETKAVGRGFTISPIDRASSTLRYLVTDAKECKDFSVSRRTVPERFFFRVALSKLVSPFDFADPPLALLPFKHAASGWECLAPTDVAASPDAKAFFDEALPAFGNSRKIKSPTLMDLFDYVNSERGKLAEQDLPENGYLVMSGAGGKWVCAAYTKITPTMREHLIIDQTLYWNVVATENEALFLSGLLNSEILSERIRPFQPKGKLGERHVHKLAFRVIPPFDPAEPKQQRVVAVTRALIDEYRARQAEPEVSALLDPCRKLDSRRTALRTFLKALKAYPAYKAACDAALSK